MKVFVFEHCCGGIDSAAASLLPLEITRQGAAMLRAVIGDFLDTDLDVTTMAHDRVTGLNARSTVTPVDESTDITATFDALASDADAALIIAPESDSLLARYQTRLDQLEVMSLGCTLDAIRLCGDKIKLAEHFNIVHIPTPPTALLEGDIVPFDFPVVVKPQFGVGCEDTFLLRNHDELAMLERSRGPYVVQPFINGVDCSCSVIAHGTQLVSLLPGEQFIRGEARLSYAGGRIPMTGSLAQRAQRLAADAAAWIPGVRGFVGVDMILGDQPADDYVIEINPRLTMSYPALQRLCATNLAAAILDGDAPITWHHKVDRYDAAGKPVKERRP